MIKPISCRFDRHKYTHIYKNGADYIQYIICPKCGEVKKREYALDKPMFVKSNDWKMIYDI
jgi:hypothetical protein